MAWMPWGDKPPRGQVPGGLPAMRPDQRAALPQSRAGSGPAPQNTVFIGRLVIIFGTGPNTGLFIYNGTPAIGNPPILSITTASSDPYGNPVTASSISDSGMPFLVYSGTPAAGNLSASFAPVAGSDRFGNAYLAGITSYGSAGTFFAATNQSSGSSGLIGWYTAATEAGPWSLNAAIAIQGATASPTDLSVSALGGAGNVILTGGSGKLIEMNNAVSLLNIATPATPTGAVVVYGASGQPAYVNPAGLQQFIAGSSLTDFTVFTVVAAVLTQLTKAWSIPANDAIIGAHYRVTARGTGTQGTMPQVLTFAASFGGINTGTGITVSILVLPISNTFGWKLEINAYCVTTGAGATWWLSSEVLVRNNTAGADVFAAANMNTATISVASNAAITFEGLAGWAATTGAPTITCNVSAFERVA
jgi:hypothetical protein